MTTSQAMKDNEAALRGQMKEMLARCTPAEQDVFRRMYDHKGKCEHPVDNIPLDKMDWAFSQIEMTLKKKAKAAAVVEYKRVPHAAHYTDGRSGGHDLEQWTFVAPTNRRPDNVPQGAEYHSGFMKDGVQHWVYVRRAELSPGTCARCA